MHFRLLLCLVYGVAVSKQQLVVPQESLIHMEGGIDGLQRKTAVPLTNAEITDTFKFYDLNADGFIKGSELSAVLGILRINDAVDTCEENVAQMILRVDLDSDGALDPAEWLLYFRPRNAKGKRIELEGHPRDTLIRQRPSETCTFRDPLAAIVAKKIPYEIAPEAAPEAEETEQE